MDNRLRPSGALIPTSGLVGILGFLADLAEPSRRRLVVQFIDYAKALYVGYHSSRPFNPANEVCTVKYSLGITSSALLLSACMTQADMEAAPIAASFTLPMNYQQAYANTNKGIRSCNTGGSGNAQTDGQLYPDLGYGEITTSLGHEFGAYVTSSVRISRVPNGTRFDLKDASKVRAIRDSWVRYWANGGVRCPSATYREAPPS